MGKRKFTTDERDTIQWLFNRLDDGTLSAHETIVIARSFLQYLRSEMDVMERILTKIAERIVETHDTENKGSASVAK